MPYTRGRSRSLPLAGVLQQTAIFAEQGYQELVITGINVGKYGLDLAEGRPSTACSTGSAAIFPACVSGSVRSSRPRSTIALLELMTSHANFMPHLHIPLQSGDDAVLARMNRRYTRAEFAAVIERVHQTLPAAAIGCDVLGGFPGETEAEAANTYDLLAELPVSYLHVFPYSRRPGTLAASLASTCPVRSKRRGCSGCAPWMRKNGRPCTGTISAGSIGCWWSGGRRKAACLQGFSENYLPIQFAGGSGLIAPGRPGSAHRCRGRAAHGHPGRGPA